MLVLLSRARQLSLQLCARHFLLLAAEIRVRLGRATLQENGNGDATAWCLLGGDEGRTPSLVHRNTEIAHALEHPQGAALASHKANTV